MMCTNTTLTPVVYKHIIGTCIVHCQLGHIFTGIKAISCLHMHTHIAKPFGLENSYIIYITGRFSIMKLMEK